MKLILNNIHTYWQMHMRGLYKRPPNLWQLAPSGQILHWESLSYMAYTPMLTNHRDTVIAHKFCTYLNSKFSRPIHI